MFVAKIDGPIAGPTEEHFLQSLSAQSCFPQQSFYPLNDNLKVTYKKKLTVEEKMISYMNTAEKSFSTYQKTALIPETYRLPLYNENNVDNHVKYLLQKMSASTLARFIKKIKNYDTVSPKGLCSTSPARYMKNKVPINTLDSKITVPGFTQADTVAHCGDNLEGRFINSVTITDIFSTWTENRAIFTKKAKEVKTALDQIEKRLPFKLLAINTDSGSEFLNTPVFNMYREKKVSFTRSRPYKKNDNCYVEQKNFTHVRELFGYQRFEQATLVQLMNEIYDDCWNPLQNYFLPTFKLDAKIRIGAKIKKKYKQPQTPFQRLMDSDHLKEDEKERLSQLKKSLNPFKLKSELEKKLSAFFKLLEEYNNNKEQEK